MPTETIETAAQVIAPTLTEQILGFVPQLLLALVIFIAFWIVSILFRATVRRFGSKTRLDDSVLDLMTQVIGLTIIVSGLLTALGTIGVDVSALVAGLGITTFAVAFALQDIIGNLLSGILILMYRPFRRGNYIRVGSHEGIVTDIDLRYTTLQTETQRILVPNRTLFQESIIVSNTTPTFASVQTPPPPPRPAQPPR